MDERPEDLDWSNVGDPLSWLLRTKLGSRPRPRGQIYPESGQRWLMFVATEPVPPVEPLLTTLASRVAPLRARR